MDVRDLAPALLGVGQLLDSANKVVNGESSSVRVKIKSTRPGSFEILFDVDFSFINTIKDMLAGPEATAAANLITFLTAGSGTGVGAIALVRWLKGRRPTSITKQPDNKVVVEINGQSIEVDAPVARLALDVRVRLSLERVVAEPLSRAGFDGVEIGDSKKPEVIKKSEGYYFLTPPDRGDGLFESHYRGPFSIVALSFKEGNKWRLHDGKSQLSAIVVDEEFLARVNSDQESFSKGDILICDVRIVTRQDSSGNLKAEYFIERVIEHRRPSKTQQSLIDFDEAEGVDLEEDFASNGTSEKGTREPPQEA